MNEPREVRYQRGRRQATMTAAGGGLLALAALATPQGAGWIAGLSHAVAARVGAGAVVAPVSAAVIVCAIWRLAMAPGHWKLAGVRAPIEGAVVALPAAALAGLALTASVAVAGARWWAALAVLAAGALAAGLVWLPNLMARAWGAVPVERPALVERLGALARRVSVPIAAIDRVPARAGRRVTAMVAGSGGARRVFIGEDLMRDWRDEEVAVVVAHELAHHAHHDLWKGWALDAAVMAAVGWAADTLVLAAGPARGLTSPADPAAVPLVAAAAAGVWTLATPLRLALSRHHERRADTFALEMTGDATAFRAAVRRLAASHQAETRPSRLTRWFFLRHPTVASRLARADEFEGRSGREGRSGFRRTTVRTTKDGTVRLPTDDGPDYEGRDGPAADG